MGLDGYPQDLPGVTKLPNSYILKRKIKINSRNTSVKEDGKYKVVLQLLGA